MRDAGVVVTVNSDDPPMFGTTLNREYEIAAGLLDLDEAGVADLARGRRRRVASPRMTSRRGCGPRSRPTPRRSAQRRAVLPGRPGRYALTVGSPSTQNRQG